MSRDRRDIVPLLLPYFPELKDLSSDDVAGFLDARTDVTTDPLMANGVAFDAWRKALAGQGYRDVWPYTAEQVTTMKARGDAFVARMDEIRAAWAARAVAGTKPNAPDEVSARRRELEAVAAQRGYKPGWVDHVLTAEATRRRKANGSVPSRV